GAYRPRSDGVHPYAAGTDLRSPGARQRREGGLRRPVGCATRETDLAGHAADVDDAALAPRRHPRRERGDEEECGADVAGEQGVERGDIEVRRRAEPREPGVVDQHVNIANSFDQTLKVGWIAEVGTNEARPAARSGNRFYRLGGSGGIAAMDDDLGAVARQLQGDCRADPGRR